MINRIYRVRDQRAEAYLQPFFAVNDNVAIRLLEQAMSDPESQFRRYSEDYILFDVGEENQVTGDVSGTTHRCVIKLIDIDRQLAETVPKLSELLREEKSDENESGRRAIGQS